MPAMFSRRLLPALTVVLLAVACANGGMTGLQYEEEGGAADQPETGTGSDGTTAGHDSSSGGNDATMSMDTASGIDSSSGGDYGGGGTCAQTCSGCCTGTVCVTTTTDNQCGTLGSPCQNCAASGLACIGAACLPGEGGATEGGTTESGAPDAASPETGTADSAPDGNPNCPTTCSGCCDANNVCWTTHTNTECPENNSPGMTGQPCVDCTAMGPAWTCFLDIIEYVCIP
jgi:hypothetical protein